MAEKQQIKHYRDILGACRDILGGFESLPSLHSRAGKLRSVKILKPVLDCGHSQLSLKPNRKFLVPIMAEKWQTKLKHVAPDSKLSFGHGVALRILRSEQVSNSKC